MDSGETLRTLVSFSESTFLDSVNISQISPSLLLLFPLSPCVPFYKLATSKPRSVAPKVRPMILLRPPLSDRQDLDSNNAEQNEIRW